ncbi:Uncharacterised protein [Klebsiella pneumoniae]|uniref:Uncharacterized protein n=1 Tax=Klebsiella pneumoniae TaxID=573 RepID=A0A2X3CIH9_KLEPN|nr:Uncharacterised protein [Klebsiella pneumoniae]
MTINGGSPAKATSAPLNRPSSRPSISAAGIDSNANSGISDTTIAATAVVPRMEPTERSMPPVRMMKVIPAASTMLIEAWRVIFSRLLSVKKLGAIKPKTATIRMRIGRMPTVCIRSPINIFFAEADFATGAEFSFGMLIVALP